MILNIEIVKEVLEEAGVGDFGRIVSIINLSKESSQANLPNNLQAVYNKEINEIIDILWNSAKDILPLTIELIKSKVVDILFIEKNRKEKFILYIFGIDEFYFGYRGNEPVNELTSIPKEISKDLIKFYKSHNGWYEVNFNDGILKEDDFEVIYDPALNKKSFLEVFKMGVNAAGFDLDSKEKLPYALWVSENNVEKINDYWSYIDKWLSDILDGYDESPVRK